MQFFFSAHVVCDINKSLLLYLLDVKTPWCYLKYVKSISLNNPHAKPDFFAKNSKKQQKQDHSGGESNCYIWIIIFENIWYWVQRQNLDCLCLITCLSHTLSVVQRWFDWCGGRVSRLVLLPSCIFSRRLTESVVLLHNHTSLTAIWISTSFQF